MAEVIPLIKPDIGEEELEAVKRVFESGFLAQGPTTKKFEQAFAKKIGVKHASATTSCTAALQLAVAALGIGEGDEVIVPSFTFPASANAVTRERASVVFCDVSLDSFNIMVDGLEEFVSDKTKAIMPVHLFGLSADMNPLMKFARAHGLRVIEDAACAAGTLYKGRHVGGFGDFGCFSFHPRKVLTTGEGGMLVSNDSGLARLAASLKDHGKDFGAQPEALFARAGFNYRLSDILAAIGLVQLAKIDETIARRCALAARYDELLEGTRGLRRPLKMGYGNHSFQSYVVLLEKEGIRDNVMKELKKKGIETQIGTYAVHLQPAYAKQKHAPLPNSVKAFRNTLTLPLYTRMTEAEQEFVVGELKKCLKKFEN